MPLYTLCGCLFIHEINIVAKFLDNWGSFCNRCKNILRIIDSSALLIDLGYGYSFILIRVPGGLERRLGVCVNDNPSSPNTSTLECKFCRKSHQMRASLVLKRKGFANIERNRFIIFMCAVCFIDWWFPKMEFAGFWDKGRPVYVDLPRATCDIVSFCQAKSIAIADSWLYLPN